MSEHKLIDERFVAYFDMLGMSALTVSDPDSAWGALSDLAKAKEEILNLEISTVHVGEVIRDRVKAFTFSDAVVAFSLSDEVADTYAIVILCTELFCRALHYCVPLRGGIAHGRFLFNLEHNLFAGPPLVSAYRLSEDAQWLGIRIDDTVAMKVRAIPLESDRGKPVVINWKVPTKSGGTVEAQVIDWVETHRSNFAAGPPLTVQQFYTAFEEMFGPYNELPASARNKYKNTVAFVNERLLDSV